MCEFLPACVYVHHMHSRKEKVLDTLELELQFCMSCPCGCWEPSLTPGSEQQVILVAEPLPRLSFVTLKPKHSLILSEHPSRVTIT